LRGCATRTGLRVRSGRSIVCVKKNRNAETMLFMVGVGTPALHCSIWNRRTSSAVAVSGERRRNVANRPMSRMSLRDVSRENLARSYRRSNADAVG
jgi:hypothetical protein